MAITPDQYRALLGNAKKNKEQKFAVANYTKVSKQWTEVGGKKYFTKSRWEHCWCLYLDFQKEKGLIKDWFYEPQIFWFEGIRRGVTNYTPDFQVINLDGTVVFHEVKGYMDKKSQTKLKRMTKYYPDVTIEVVDEKRFKSVETTAGPIIKGWHWS